MPVRLILFVEGVSPFLKNKRIATLAGTLANDRQLRRHF